LDAFALLVAVAGWGTNFIAIRFAVTEMPVPTTLAVRFVLVSLLLAPFVGSPRGQFGWLVLVTLALAPGHIGLLFWATQVTTSVSSVALFIQLGPAFCILLAWALLRERPGRWRLIGLALATAGVAILYWDPNLLADHQAFLIATGAALCMGIYSVLLRWPGGRMPPLAIIGWISILAAPGALVLAWVMDGAPWEILARTSGQAWVAVAYTAVVGSIGAHGAWAWLCRRHPLALITPFSLLVPILAVALSALILSEPLTTRFVLAATVLFVGLLVIIRTRPISP
jgi:O-acetylserine/cysteine efflux transporter